MLPEFPPYSLRRVIKLELQLALAKLDPIASLPGDAISVRRSPCNSGIAYKSAIAFQLSSSCQQNLTEMATRLIEKIPSDSLDFSVRLVAPAWIYFDWNHSAAAKWLESWLDLRPSKTLDTIDNSKNLNLFPLQYIHARCCSILRLAADRGWLQVEPSSAGNFLFPKPVPWFDERGLRYFSNPHEAKAIASLVDLADNLLSNSPAIQHDCLKLAMNLADSYYDLEGIYQLNPGISTKNRVYILHSLCAIAIIKNSLRLVLESLFATRAVTEL